MLKFPFIFSACLLCWITSSGWTQKYISEEALWKHVVAIDRLTWVEHQDSKTVNKMASPELMVRRLYLDTIGRLPTYSEFKSYLNDKQVNKQQTLLQQLLSSPGYALYYAEFWMDLLRIPHDESSSRFYSDYNAFHNYIRRSLHTNKAYDVLVKELINSKGTYLDDPAVGFYMRDLLTNYMDTVNSTVKVFLGTRIGCAQCHNHRFDKWTQKEFYETSAFFHGTKASVYGNSGFADIIESHIDNLVRKKQLKLENTKTYGVKRALRETSRGTVSYSPKQILTYPEDYRYNNAKASEKVKERIIFGYGAPEIKGKTRREQFANWLASKENKVFAKVMANRLWKRLMGIGLLEPIDDYKDNIVIQNPELYDYLGEVFINVNYDFKAFLSILLNTQAYAMKVHPKNEINVANYKVQGNRLRRMSSQQIDYTLQSFSKGKIEIYNRLDPDYFEFDDKLREIGSNFLKTYYELKRMHNKKHGQNYEMIEPEISKLIKTTVDKINELEAYHDIDQHGYLKSFSKDPYRFAMQNDKVDLSENKKDMSMMMATMGNKKKNNGSGYHDMVSNAHQSKTYLKNLFGESDRSQSSNSGSEEPTSLQILKLLSDKNIYKAVGPDSFLIKQLKEQKSFSNRVSFLYYCIYGRAPSKHEFGLAKEYIDEANNLQLWSEFAHAMLNSPEFFFIQ